MDRPSLSESDTSARKAFTLSAAVQSHSEVWDVMLSHESGVVEVFKGFATQADAQQWIGSATVGKWLDVRFGPNMTVSTSSATLPQLAIEILSKS